MTNDKSSVKMSSFTELFCSFLRILMLDVENKECYNFSENRISDTLSDIRIK
ncbi:hypothetical protein SRRS_30750 [Sporomusa rhizae]